MNRNWLTTKAGVGSILVAGTLLVGSVGTVYANNDQGNQGDQGGDNQGMMDTDHGGYAHSQCADGAWRNFKNPDGSQKFKNQGQCIRFFNQAGNENSQGLTSAQKSQLQQLFAQFFAQLNNFLHSL